MTERRQWFIVAGLGTVYLAGLGVLAGIASERFRFEDVRGQIVHRSTVAKASWPTRLQEVDDALARRDVNGAERVWRDAYGEALRTRAWRPLLDIGDAALRIGAVAADRPPYVTRAREAYLAALTRARASQSRRGVLSAGEAFDALGDYEVARQCQIIADTLGGRRATDADAREDAFRSRVVDAHAVPAIEP